MASLLSVRNLDIHFRDDSGEVHAVKDLSFDLQQGKTLALVGASGSGKSAAALSVLGLLEGNARVSGQILFHGQNLVACHERELRGIRGRRIAMIFQEPMTSLNPVFTVGNQIIEVLRRHESLSHRDAAVRAVELLAEVGIAEAAEKFKAYPHELSGGQRQRAMIAMAIACKPEVLIADEPTTALDILVQKQILDLISTLQKKYGMAVLLITHDVSVVAARADEVLMMKADTERTISAPLRSKAVSPSSGETVLEIKGLSKSYPVLSSVLRRPQAWKPVLENIDLNVKRGRVLGLVGPSGCGKTTLARLILRLTEPSAGQILFGGRDITALQGEELRRLRSKIQIVFQDPYSSLNPKLKIGSMLTEPMRAHGIGASEAERRERATGLMKRVGLQAEWLERYPHEFSGGQRQRIGIARALSVEPDFIICDEAVSALDLASRTRILDLLSSLKEELGLTYIFISHDLELARSFADDIAVMDQGRIVESGPAEGIFQNPRQEITRRLIEASQV